MEESELLKRRKALIQTITFFDIFDFALTREEICDYMLYKQWTLAELKEFTNHEAFLVETHSHVYLKGRPLNIAVRKDKEHQARKLIKKAKKHVKLMQMLPFVRTVALCNSLSFYNAERESDIDLFIITEKKRLFLARTMVWLYTQLLGLRRHGKTKGRFCLTFFVTRDALNLEKIKYDDDIYFAFWLRLMRPLIGQKTYREFVSKNIWIKEYFDYEIDQKKHLLPESKRLIRLQKILEFPLKGFLGDCIETILKKWQKKRSEKKAQKLENRDGIIVSDTVLKFHNQDMRKRYQSLWERRYGQFKQYLETTSPSDYDKQFLPQYHRSQTPFSVRSPRSDDTKNETSLRHSQREQIQAD